MIFRGNTFATKAVDTYMKMVGDTVSNTISYYYTDSFLWRRLEIHVLGYTGIYWDILRYPGIYWSILGMYLN